MAELRLEVLMEAERTGLTVTEIRRRYGISRQTYYRYRRRYLAEGLAGLEDRSRKPLHPANQIPADLEVKIVEMRKVHPRWGARRIRAELTRTGVDPPVVSTIHQVLVRNGLVAVRPPRRQKADKRFEREIANDLWQIDATRIMLADNTDVWVVDVIDDHSRYLLAAVAGPAATGDLAWDTFEIAASRYGLPRQVLSDNGLIFTGRLHSTEVAFEVSLKDLGVELINSAPYHPQTLGKLERFHRTVRFPDPTEMTEPDYPADAYIRKVAATGNIGWRGKLIHVGTRYATAHVRIIEVDQLVHIYHGDALIRALHHRPQPLLPTQRRTTTPTTTKKCHITSQYKVSHITPVQTMAAAKKASAGADDRQLRGYPAASRRVFAGRPTEPL